MLDFGEAQLLEELQHPNIVNIKEQLVYDKKLYLVLEYCDGLKIFPLITILGGDLKKFIN